MSRILPVAGLGLLLAMIAGGGAAFGEGPKNAGQGELALLMQRNFGHLHALVQTAFFETAMRKPETGDYQQIRREAEAIAKIARQAQQAHSRGAKFDELAAKLEKHAEKASAAAARHDLAEINVEVGEMAEYCAKCHAAFRW
jgi:cytochrome c556